MKYSSRNFVTRYTTESGPTPGPAAAGPEPTP